jgi:hypothetical protein
VAYYLGLDLGQSAEPTALAVVEDRLGTSPNGNEERQLFLRHLERYPLHTRYPRIAKKGLISEASRLLSFLPTLARARPGRRAYSEDRR